jgi:hypothetical protein
LTPTGEPQFYLNDHLGSARAMVGNGWSATYYSFGVATFVFASKGIEYVSSE